MAYLEAEDARHALRVLRLDVGAQVQLFADGQAYAASICQTGPDGVAVRVLEKLKSPEASLRVTLYQGVPKGDKMDYIVQKCTEAGVCRIVPVEMPRCVAHLDGKDDKKLARWNRIAREAAKQAFRPVTPEVAAPIDLNALCRALPGHQLALVPWEDAREGTLPQLISPDIADLAIVIGPEGGMGESEVQRMLDSGARAVTLGPRIFRTETAGLAAIIAAMALSGHTVPIDDPRLASEAKLAIVLGTEGDGLAPQTVAACDYTVCIPMSHGVDSLNVAAASAVAFWQLGKQ